MEINYHVDIIDKKLSEYFTRNYVLNKRYLSVRLIILIYLVIFIIVKNY